MTLDFSALPDVSDEHPELAPEERWYAAHMKARESALEAVFGATEPPNTILAPSDADVSVNWPGGGFHRYPPRGERTSWLFVTHGLAQPFEENDVHALRDDPDALSGVGLEYVVAAPDGEATWAPDLLLGLVRYVLFHEDGRPLEPGHRMACGTAIGGRGLLRHVLATLSPEYEIDLLLPAGHCLLVHLVGVTDAEIAKAKVEEGILGSLILERVLYAFGVGGLTDPDRACLTEREDFDAVWSDVRAEVIAEQAEDEDEGA